MFLQPHDGADQAGPDEAVAEALRELQEMLHLAAVSRGSLPRAAAPTYVRLRDMLLKSDRAASLPGFLQQCLTIDRFCDFIHLYHPEAAKRAEFLNEVFRSRPNSRSGARRRAVRDVFADSEF